MRQVVGIAWAGSGWIAASLRAADRNDVEVFPSILTVWRAHREADRLLIDIPIGLAESGKRECDVRAKTVLSPTRPASVFWTPVRAALDARTLADAKDRTEPAGFTLSNQAWALLPRIRAVDGFLDQVPTAIGRLRESHPEVCFAALNDGEPMDHAKTTDAGVAERRALLVDLDDKLAAVYDAAVSTYIDRPTYARRLSTTARDAILDALVLAHTADRSAQRLATLPDEPPRDTAATPPRPMEIVYPAL